MACWCSSLCAWLARSPTAGASDSVERPKSAQERLYNPEWVRRRKAPESKCVFAAAAVAAPTLSPSYPCSSSCPVVASLVVTRCGNCCLGFGSDPLNRDAAECTFKPQLVAKPVSGSACLYHTHPLAVHSSTLALIGTWYHWLTLSVALFHVNNPLSLSLTLSINQSFPRPDSHSICRRRPHQGPLRVLQAV